jgi:hypothetical protein
MKKRGFILILLVLFILSLNFVSPQKIYVEVQLLLVLNKIFVVNLEVKHVIFIMVFLILIFPPQENLSQETGMILNVLIE